MSLIKILKYLSVIVFTTLFYTTLAYFIDESVGAFGESFSAHWMTGAIVGLIVVGVNLFNVYRTNTQV